MTTNVKVTIPFMGGKIICQPAGTFEGKNGEQVNAPTRIQVVGLSKYPINLPASFIHVLCEASEKDIHFMEFLQEIS